MEHANLGSPMDRVQEVLERRSDVILAYLFGSSADGSAAPDSDLDVAVYGQDVLGVDARSELMRELAIASGRPVDLVDLRTAGVPLLQQILTKGTEVVCRDRRTKEHLILRMLGEVEDFLPLRRRLLKTRRDRWIRMS